MSFIKSISKKNVSEQISSSVTLKLTLEEDSILSIACKNTGYSRNELMYLLLKTYVFDDESSSQMVEKHENEYKNLDIYPNYHVINTNIGNDVADDMFMVTNGIAAAFEDGYKEKINNIKKGDMVFLYRSKTGIIAQGVASGEVLRKTHYDIPDKTFYQKLSDFKLYEKPLKPSKIKKILGREVVFMHTWFTLPDGYNLLKHQAENQAD